MSTIKFRRMKKDDPRFDLKKGDIVVVETNYDWDPDKCICIGKLVIHNDHSLYNEQIEVVHKDELVELKR